MNDTSFRWHYLVYRITNLDNGRYYIGQHRTTNPNDSYMGSGVELNADYERYVREGKDISLHFKKEILFDFGTFEEMNDKEKELVDESVVADPMSYNRVGGGSFQMQYPKGCIIIEHDGRKGSLKEWSEWIGMSPNVIRQRYKKGMSMDHIISIPPRERDKVWFASNGEGHTIYEWCEKYGLEYSRISARLRAGWSVDRAITERKCTDGRICFYHGKPYTLNKLAEMAGIPKSTLTARINSYKWSVEKAVETPLIYNPVSIWEQKFEWKGGSYTIEELAGLSNGLVFKQTIHDRIKEGWDIDRIMSTPSPAVDSSWRKKLYDYHGRKITIDEGAKIANLTPGGLKLRLEKSKNLTFEQAVDMPRKNKRGKLFYINGIGKTIHDWAEEYGMRQNLLYQRMMIQKMTIEEAIAFGKPKPHKPYVRRSK